MATPRSLNIRASHTKDWYLTNASHPCLAFPLQGEGFETELAFLKACALDASARTRQLLAGSRSLGAPRDPRAYSHILPKPRAADAR